MRYLQGIDDVYCGTFHSVADAAGVDLYCVLQASQCARCTSSHPDARY